ncbi:hypothetical protein Tco_1049912, partial [Tanacetum coccineum]
MEAVEVPQTLEYKGGQLNVAHVLEVENFTNWKKSSCAISFILNPNLQTSFQTVLISLWKLVKGSQRHNGHLRR